MHTHCCPFPPHGLTSQQEGGGALVRGHAERGGIAIGPTPKKIVKNCKKCPKSRKILNAQNISNKSAKIAKKIHAQKFRKKLRKIVRNYKIAKNCKSHPPLGHGGRPPPTCTSSMHSTGEKFDPTQCVVPKNFFQVSGAKRLKKIHLGAKRPPK